MQQFGQARQRAMRRRNRRRRCREEREPRRWRIGRESAYRIEPADLERAEAFAQRRFESRLPAGLDADAAPQSLQRLEAVLGEPGLELVFDLDFFLQGLQARRAGRQARPGGAPRRSPRPAATRRASSRTRQPLLPARAVAPRRRRRRPAAAATRWRAAVEHAAGSIGTSSRSSLSRRSRRASAWLRRSSMPRVLGRQHLDLLGDAADDLALCAARRLRRAPGHVAAASVSVVLVDALGQRDGSLLRRLDARRPRVRARRALRLRGASQLPCWPCRSARCRATRSRPSTT